MIRRLARPLLGAAFISSGLEAWQGLDRRTSRAEALGVPEPVNATRAVAATQVGAGALLALNRMPRLVALLLAVTVVPEAVTGHDFWNEKDSDAKRGLRALFARDLGLLGGLLIAAVETGGRESLPHRAGRRSKEAAAAVVH
jgi:uncharacterized membrane protein YphA (DoxX/SURF4 family)